MARNFVGAQYSARAEEVLVWERDTDHPELSRILKKYPAPYYFYVPSPEGEHRSMFGEPLKKLTFDSKGAFESGIKRNQKKFESDISPVEKILMANYHGVDAPRLNYTLLDIEVDYKKDKYSPEHLVNIRSLAEPEKTSVVTALELREADDLAGIEAYDERRKLWVDAQYSHYMYDGQIGYSSPENPYAVINAITLFNQWNKEYLTFAIPPPSWTGKDWDALLDKTLHEKSKITLFKTEKELLKATLLAIRDSDVVSGWNSDFFDLPYLIKRTEIVLGAEATKYWCFNGCPAPRFEEVERFNEIKTTARIYGRTHLDYLQLFKKFAFGGRSSYSLKSIAAEELHDMEKIEYAGSLDELYDDDFNFFIRYNIRDTEILDKLDEKFKYIELASEVTHANTTVLASAMGSVKVIDSGIINHCHYALNLIVADRNSKVGPSIEGAMVLNPKIGLHEWIGSVDINSLYPSTMRSLNISPEKIIGQFTVDTNPMKIDGESDWLGIANGDDKIHTLYFEDGEYAQLTGKEWRKVLADNKWAVSAFGTVFDQGNGMGVIPGLLATWYSERKKLQAAKVEWGNKADTLKAGSPEYIHAKKMEEYYDKKQMVKKLNLNSLYGALINQYDRFYDFRLGASTTATGRQITGHMTSKIAELLTGEYTPVIKITDYEAMEKDEAEDTYGYNVYECANDSVIYGDTDSNYFKTGAKNKEEAIAIADEIGVKVNESFIPFMREKFLCQPEYDVLIKAGREVVADRGIFQAKKKYILRVVNLDGKDVKPGSSKYLKVMGGEIKKSDTPKVIQAFLKEVTLKILDGVSYSDIEEYVNNERRAFKTATDMLSIGIPKAVNKLEMYYAQYLELEKPGVKRVRLPGHVRASINFNEHLLEIKDRMNQPIKSGNKVKIFYLKPNDQRFTSIAVPSDADSLPTWFKDDFIIDIAKTEEKLIDLKLESIFVPIGWLVPTFNRARANKLLVW